ncbi:MAG TPA: N-acetylmuramoyl-L-alanine amidase [Vicinamibacterales bacterium]|nr:N-acetylmuramoyl-L-alanine amidase [Vicinamibacterales bacterium]
MLRRTALSVSVLAFALLASDILLSQQTPLTVLSKDGNNVTRRTLPTTTVNEQEYVALDDLASMFQLIVREDALGALSVSSKGKTLLLTPDQPLASIAGRVVSLPAPPVRQGRRWLVPVDFIGRALSLVSDTRITLRRPSHLVIVGDLRVPRVQVRYDTSGATTGRLTLDATPRANSAISQEGDQLVVRFDADAIDVSYSNTTAAPLAAAGAQGLLQAVRVPDLVTLSFTTGPRFGGFRITTQPSDTSMRETIDITNAGGPQTTEATPPQTPPVAPLPSDLNTAASSLRTIVIDPGHGGEDEGAKGAQGTKEKDVTLAVARRVKAALEARLGIRVLLTREDDRAVPIDERTALANNSKADLFISLHANASWRPTLSGATISTARFSPQDEEMAHAVASELLPAINGAARGIDFIPWDVAQIQYVTRSEALARTIAEHLQGKVPLTMNAVESQPMRVLEPANMPAVLIELGYLTNAEQEKQLAGSDFQTTFVQAVVDAVVKFHDEGGR